MRLFILEWKKLFRTEGVRKLCLALLTVNLALVLFGVLAEPDDVAKQNHIDSYQQSVSAIVRTATYNLGEYEARLGPNNYLVQYQQQVIDRYAALLTQGIAPRPTNGWNAYFDYTADGLLLFLFAILTGAILSASEQENGTDVLLSVTPRGKRSAKYKLAVTGVVALGSVVALETATLLGIAFRFGLSSPHVPLCSAIRFAYCPSAISIGTYLCLSVLAKGMFAWILMLGTGILASLLRGYLAPISVSAGLLAAGYGLSQIPTNNGWLYLNLYALGLWDPLFVRYRSANLLGISVPLIALAVVLLLLLFVGLFFTFLQSSSWSAGSLLQKKTAKNYILSLREHVTRLFPHAKPRRRTLFATEIRKSLLGSRLLLLCLAALILKGVFAMETMPEAHYKEQYYKEICLKISGELTADKREQIKETLENSQEVLSQLESMRNAMQNGFITHEEYSEFLEKHARAELDEYVYSRLTLQCARIDDAAAKGQNAVILYDTGWQNALSHGSDVLLYIFLILFFSGIYTAEYTGGFSLLVQTTPRGMRAIHRRKILLAVIVAFIFTILFWSVDLLLSIRSFPLHNATATLASVHKTAFDIPLWCALALSTFLQIAKAITLAILSCLSSRFLRKVYLAIPTGIFFCFFLYFIP